MPKKDEQDPNRSIMDALEQIDRTMTATNKMLERLSETLTNTPPDPINRVVDDFALRPEFAAQARSKVLEDAPAIDEGILQSLAGEKNLQTAMERLIGLRNARYPNSRPRYWAIVDFDLRSSEPRMFVFDVVSQSTASYLCAHGIGSEGRSDDGYANVFSNVSGSNASSLGIYRCAETYTSSKNGYSLKLDGLQSTNSNARSRFIVVHGAYYVSEDFSRRYGRIGRSEGCPALDNQYARNVIDQLKLGSLLLLWKAP